MDKSIQCYQCGTRITLSELVKNQDDCPECGAQHQINDVAKALDLNTCAKASQGGEAVAWHTEDHLADKSATTYDLEVAERWRTKGWPVTPLYTHPADQVADPLKQIAWKRRDGVMGCKRFMTQKVYDAQSPQMKGNYQPFYCAHCVADQVAEPDADKLAQFIRQIDGDNRMGAGALAEHICEWLAKP